jgi:hypothetical protein
MGARAVEHAGKNVAFDFLRYIPTVVTSGLVKNLTASHFFWDYVFGCQPQVLGIRAIDAPTNRWRR